MDPEDERYFAEQKRHREKFFGLIGHCVTLYQTVEDYLEEVFAAALGGNQARASAMFAVARGLEAKLNIVAAALVGRGDDLAKYWPALAARVGKAAKARNEIAHATPEHRGETITVTIDKEKMEAVRAERTAAGRMELRKRTKAGETVWTLDQMFAEYARTEKVFVNLIGFVKLLQGEVPLPHLLDGLEG